MGEAIIISVGLSLLGTEKFEQTPPGSSSSYTVHHKP